MAVPAIGLTPMSPVMTEVGTVEMPVFDKTANPAARPRSTGAVRLRPSEVVTNTRMIVSMSSAKSGNRKSVELLKEKISQKLASAPAPIKKYSE